MSRNDILNTSTLFAVTAWYVIWIAPLVCTGIALKAAGKAVRRAR